MLAIMGASGAGKTTLLSILSHKADPNLHLEGEILANNTPFTSSSFYNFGVYVYQNDILHSSLTVRGTHLLTQKPSSLPQCSSTTTLRRLKNEWMS
jgi:ABC-type multidrug transport system ATPase subunit